MRHADLYYIETGTHQLLPVDVLRWADHLEHANREVATTIDAAFVLYTSFIGIDYSFGTGPPLVYETMLEMPGNQAFHWRHHTRPEAMLFHAAVVDAIHAGKTVAQLLREVRA